MAALQERNGSYRVLFQYNGRQLSLPVGKVSREEALAEKGKVENLLLRLEQRFATIPPGLSIVEYLKFDGRPLAPQLPEAKAIKLSLLKDKYVAANKASLEPTTLGTLAVHFKHLEKGLGASFHINKLKLADLQDYVNQRAKAKGKNGRTLSATTIQKEINTLRTAWKWGSKNGYVSGPCPCDGLRYPRVTEKPIFMTRAEIERHIAAGDLDEATKAELWGSLYLTIPETKKFLKHIKSRALQPFLYPAVCFVAYTGARRSEMLRARVRVVKKVARGEKKLAIPRLAGEGGRREPGGAGLPPGAGSAGTSVFRTEAVNEASVEAGCKCQPQNERKGVVSVGHFGVSFQCVRTAGAGGLRKQSSEKSAVAELCL